MNWYSPQRVQDLQPWHTVVKRRRLALGASLSELAAMIGSYAAKLQKIESRTMKCPVETGFALAELFEVGIEHLVGSDGFALTLRDSEEYLEGQLELAEVTA